MLGFQRKYATQMQTNLFNYSKTHKSIEIRILIARLRVGRHLKKWLWKLSRCEVDWGFFSAAS